MRRKYQIQRFDYLTHTDYGVKLIQEDEQLLLHMIVKVHPGSVISNK